MEKAENQEAARPGDGAEPSPPAAEPLTRERVRGIGEGSLEPAAVAEVLEPTAWTCSPRRTTAGVVHLLERPLSFAEASRLDVSPLKNHRRAASVARNPDGTFLLRYLVMRDIHESDLLILPEIERRAAGTGRFGREDFRPAELEVIDRIWKSGEEISDQLGIKIRVVDHYVYLSRRRTGARTREELLVMGLRDGFCEPESAEVPAGWSDDLSPSQREIIPLLHLPTADIAERLCCSRPAIQERVIRCFEKTGSKTRGELILRAIANGAYDVRTADLAEGPLLELTDRQEAIAGMLERSNDEIREALGLARNRLHDQFWELRQRLGAADRKELVLRAIELGYVEADVDSGLAEQFTPREQDVLSLIMLPRSEIARRLGISKSSVSQYAGFVMEKTDIHHAPGLVAYGVRAGLIEVERRIS